MDDFFLRALAGGVGVALASGPVGCFTVWRGMAYFGSALAHTLLLGVALGLLLSVEPTITVLATCLLLAGSLAIMERRPTVSIDSLLGVLAHIAFALGLVAIAFMEQVRVDLIGYLLGDILSIGPVDLWIIFGTAAATGGIITMQWRNLLSMTVNRDLAAVEGVPVERTRFLLIFLLASVIAVGMKLVGMLLIIAMVIIPAAAARQFSRTPERMVVTATLIGIASSVAGLFASMEFDLPAGPAIVLVSGSVFVAGQLVSARQS